MSDEMIFILSSFYINVVCFLQFNLEFIIIYVLSGTNIFRKVNDLFL